MMLAILVFAVVIALLAQRFGVDSRDGMDWRPYEEASQRR
ncbi:hypothetical protein GCM10009539_66990 [Cryptosporangium japonicum]|uniref:Uncharacterized protein n=2 Tax=Cryptosporangium TaxID=65502 RepID=A0A011ABV1_9ACTN|nr:hypothetical protein CryarDRAFT_0547 [Cryptosporangium arvum DSM 44712]